MSFYFPKRESINSIGAPLCTVMDLALLHRHDTLAHAAAILSAQAMALAALPAVGKSHNESIASFESSLTDLNSAAQQLQQRQHEMADWLGRVATEARAQREQLARERASFVAAMRSADNAQGELSTLTSELRSLHWDIEAMCDGTSTIQAECGTEAGRGSGSAAGSSAAGSSAVDSSGDEQAAKQPASGNRPFANDSGMVRLNVGGEIYCTTLDTLRSEESMLSVMFAGRFDPHIHADRDGAVFIDRDGTLFRHILNVRLPM